MAKQTIGVGTSANDGTGDPDRTAWQKVNANFTELYNALLSSDSITTSGSPVAADADTATTFVTISSDGGTVTLDLPSSPETKVGNIKKFVTTDKLGFGAITFDLANILNTDGGEISDSTSLSDALSNQYDVLEFKLGYSINIDPARFAWVPYRAQQGGVHKLFASDIVTFDNDSFGLRIGGTLALLSNEGNVEITGSTGVMIHSLPTSDPTEPDQLYVDVGGFVKQSTG